MKKTIAPILVIALAAAPAPATAQDLTAVVGSVETAAAPLSSALNIPPQVREGIKAVVLLAIIAGIIGGAVEGAKASGTLPNDGGPGATQNSLKTAAKAELDQINQLRRKLGRQELIWDEEMYEQAMAWSAKLGKTDGIEHNTKGYYYSHLGENIAAGSPASSLADMWIDEGPGGGHYRSITYDKLRYAAIGITQHQKYGYVATFLGAADAGAHNFPMN